ncbi:MAG: CBS domain-containing protein [Candidatus Omnitrophica bacterium]|nr:CBS domain-containing protein [Candidatus Omnitrophota bacterium]
METKLAEDLAIPLSVYPHLPYWFTIRQAILELREAVIEMHEKRSLPREILIFDEKYKLLGSARRRDLLRGLEPQFSSTEKTGKLFEVIMDPNLLEFSYDKLLENMHQSAEKPISEIMRPIKKTINHDDHILKVIYEMVENDLSLIPVMKENKVIGVVRTVDIFDEISDMLFD